MSSGSSDEVDPREATTVSVVGQLPTQLPRRNNLSLKEGDVGLHHQKSGCYGVVRLRNGEMTMETRVGVHMVRM